MKKQITLSEAMEVLIDRLKNDEDMWDAWRQYIINAYWAEMLHKEKPDSIPVTGHNTAERFLKQLTGKK